MNVKTAKLLHSLNNEFYANNSVSFAKSRHAPWKGWELLLPQVKKLLALECRGLSVFDLACGNLRFAIFLAEKLPKATISYHAVDNCDLLVPAMPQVSYQSLDVVDALYRRCVLKELLDAPVCDLSVSFGFMHHLPLQVYREEIFASLLQQTKPGGLIAVSFWQFLNNKTLANKALITHERALEELGLRAFESEFNEGDFLLGWKDIPGAYRYCHSFSEEEIDQLLASLAGKATLVSRFAADGRTGDLNTYAVLQKD